MLITDQVATAPCTDLVQEWFRTFEAKLSWVCKVKKDSNAESVRQSRNPFRVR